ncbi:MAG: hypothetical protein LAT82_03090 [Nanoarchaeota archaeon]|nr:hypothetical protein [Nanoarchaeota archaeon]
MNLSKKYNEVDGLFLLSILIMLAAILFMPWTDLPITGGIEFINENLLFFSVPFLMFFFALFFVDDKLSALLNGGYVVLALLFILFHFFNFGGIYLSRSMVEDALTFEYMDYGVFVFTFTAIISATISYYIFKRDDE